MKKIIFLLAISYTGLIHAQDINSIYVFIAPTMNIDSTIQFKKNHKIKVIDTLDKHVSFVYLKFDNGTNTEKLNERYYYKQNDSLNEGVGTFIKSAGNDGNSELREIKIFKLETSAFNKFTTKYYPLFKGVTAGVFTVPFKIRISDFDFEQNINIGMNLGFPFRLNRKLENNWLLSPTLGIGLSSINLNPKNSALAQNENEDANRSASAFSISGGLLLQFNETINIGVQLGWDYLGNIDKNIHWKYDRKPWVGIGINIGVSLSKSKTPSSPSLTN